MSGYRFALMIYVHLNTEAAEVAAQSTFSDRLHARMTAAKEKDIYACGMIHVGFSLIYSCLCHKCRHLPLILLRLSGGSRMYFFF